MKIDEYEKALNDSIRTYRNAVGDKKADIPQGYGVAFDYGYNFGLQQARSEQKESEEKQLDFQRTQIATAAMQGLLNATSVERFTLRIKPEALAQAAVEYADALINELKKPKDEMATDK